MSNQVLSITESGEDETVITYRGRGEEAWLAAALITPLLAVFGSLILGEVSSVAMGIAFVVMLVLFGVAAHKEGQWPEMEEAEAALYGRLHATEKGIPHLVLADHDPGTGHARLRLMSAEISCVNSDRRVTTFHPLKTVIIDPIAGEREIQAMAEQLARKAEELELQSHVQHTLAQEAQRPAAPEVEDVTNLAVARAALPSVSRNS